jgi:hypothetical protein
MAKKKKKWIQKADIKEGALTAMAAQAGFPSWETFCDQPGEKLSPLAKKRCVLAKTLTNIAKK